MRCTFIRAVIRRALQGKTESPKLEKKNNIERKSVDRLRVSNSRGNFCELLVLNQTEETGLTKRNGSENILLDRFSHPVGVRHTRRICLRHWLCRACPLFEPDAVF